MKTLPRLNTKKRKAAAAAGATFALANPFFTVFLAGVGLAIWHAWKSRRDA